MHVETIKRGNEGEKNADCARGSAMRRLSAVNDKKNKKKTAAFSMNKSAGGIGRAAFWPVAARFEVEFRRSGVRGGRGWKESVSLCRWKG